MREVMVKQTQDDDVNSIFPTDQLLPLDNLSYSAFDALPLMTTFESDPLYSSLDIVPSHTLFQEDYLFGYENEFGFQPKDDQMMLCLENNVVENVENPMKINSKKQRKGCWSLDQKSSDTERMKLSRKNISDYFYLPIKQAANELNVGLTVLKKRCRELGISRWPHRKLVSLQTLIKNVQAIEEKEGEGKDGGLSEAIKILKEEIKLIEKAPNNELEDTTKRLRQACFKARYKKKKLMGMNMELDHHNLTSINSSTDDHDDEEINSLLMFDCFAPDPDLVCKI